MRKYFLVYIFIVVSSCVLGQTRKVENLKKFNHRTIHFGFLLGANRADFSYQRFPPQEMTADTLLSIEAKGQMGFNIGLISALHFNEYFSVRFTPNLAFSQRNIDYTFRTPLGDGVFTKEIESTFINFPLTFKYKSVRLNNFSAYIIGGGAYSLDLASNKDSKNFSQNPNDIFVKLKKHDVLGEIGVGTEFYLEYFKFGVELKMSYGLFDMLERDDTIFSDPYEQLRSKILLISFTFEG